MSDEDLYDDLYDVPDWRVDNSSRSAEHVHTHRNGNQMFREVGNSEPLWEDEGEEEEDEDEDYDHDEDYH